MQRKFRFSSFEIYFRVPPPVLRGTEERSCWSLTGVVSCPTLLVFDPHSQQVGG